jgi:hypothetical protein
MATCKAITHDNGDNLEPCTRPAVRAGYCKRCLPSLYQQAWRDYHAHLENLKLSARRIMELEEPANRDAAFNLVTLGLAGVVNAMGSK